MFLQCHLQNRFHALQLFFSFSFSFFHQSLPGDSFQGSYGFVAQRCEGGLSASEYAGSNPAEATRQQLDLMLSSPYNASRHSCDEVCAFAWSCANMPQSLNGRASAFQAGDAGSTPVCGSMGLVMSPSPICCRSVSDSAPLGGSAVLHSPAQGSAYPCSPPQQLNMGEPGLFAAQAPAEDCASALPRRCDPVSFLPS